MKNVLSLQTNEILDANPTYYGESVKAKIKREILLDYSKGIKSGKISIFPKDFYNENGSIVKTWKNGEILEVNDIIKLLDKDNNSYIKDDNNNDICFRIVDRSISYKGQVLIDYELQEIKNI